jgi:hypothetical protein
VLIVGRPVAGAQMHDWHEPMPVQQRDVVVTIRRGMPSQQMVVIAADFARSIVMADIVIVRLGERNVNEAQNQRPDSDSNCRAQK